MCPVKNNGVEVEKTDEKNFVFCEEEEPETKEERYQTLQPDNHRPGQKRTGPKQYVGIPYSTTERTWTLL